MEATDVLQVVKYLYIISIRSYGLDQDQMQERGMITNETDWYIATSK